MMKKIILLILFATLSISAKAKEQIPQKASPIRIRKIASANLTTVCGVNKVNGEKIRLEIILDKEDEFSNATVLTINDQTPSKLIENGAAGFGYKRYESIKLELDDSCKGSATYKHYDAKMPMNPMEDLVLKCICK